MVQNNNSPFSFSGISRSSYDRLQETLMPCAFPKGHNLVVPGQIQNEMYFVRDGVQMSFYEDGDKFYVMAFTYASDICVLPDSFSLQAPAKYTITCLTASKFDYISFQDLQLLFNQCPDLERFFRIATERVLAGVLDRHLELKTSSIEERFRNFCQRSSHLLNLVPHKYIASYLNINATNFSKLFNSVRIG